ncbi:hypothetical protein ACHAW5_003843 [Stephanodiscus triporus]|uniref:Uncharacterized protein n=1 Tax=Stephanodiscus triporus TaxID=2934178 RepID=A0ABD3MZI5_9STRA
MTTLRPSSPVAKSLEGDLPQQEHQNTMRQVSAEATAVATYSAEAVSNDNNCGGNNDITGGVSSSSSSSSSTIPNLLSFGKFSPRSPKKAVATYVSSPTIPAAPPSTPFTPNNNNIINPMNHRFLLSSPPLMPEPNIESSNSMTSASSPFAPSPPPFNIRPISPGMGGIGGVAAPPSSPSHHNNYYDALLRQALSATAERERSRIEALTGYESENYSTIEQYQRALAHERRYSAALALDVTKLSFHTRYTSCDVHAAAEVSEEARINNMIKNMTTLKKDMNEDRCRVMMELEREEEGIINRLMMRLEEVTREKRLLECRIKGLQGNIEGGKVGGGDDDGGVGVQGVGVGRGLMGDRNDEHRPHAHFERMMMMVNNSDRSDGKHQVLHDAAVAKAPLLEREDGRPTREHSHFPPGAAADGDAEEGIIGTELVICKDNKVNNEGEDDEEEVEEDGDGADDILEGQCHNDSDMEEELEKLLKMKEEQHNNTSA